MDRDEQLARFRQRRNEEKQRKLLSKRPPWIPAGRATSASQQRQPVTASYVTNRTRQEYSSIDKSSPKNIFLINRTLLCFGSKKLMKFKLQSTKENCQAKRFTQTTDGEHSRDENTREAAR